MLVSLAWLRALVPFEQTAEEAAEVLTARGLTVDSVSAVGDDTVLELDVPANRPDCLGHLGVARELAAALGGCLTAPGTAPAGEGAPVHEQVQVRIEAPDLCPRYTARLVRGVKFGPSPAWVVARLEACGLRSINNVVDASSLVMLESGNPIHFFDLARLERATIVVRCAATGETLTTLDGVEHRLNPEMLVIADAVRPVALAGVMGGFDTEIKDATRDVLIEAAYFVPSSIRATAKRLGLHTGASHRFERGVDPDGVLAAQDLAVRLLAQLTGGRPAPGLIDEHPRPQDRPVLRLRPQRIQTLVGYRPADEEVRAALEALALAVEAEQDGGLVVHVPSWRVDLQREADLVEEVARHIGYDRIPLESGGGGPAPRSEPADAELRLEERSRDRLAHLGFHEAFSYAMIGAAEDDPFVPEETPPALELTNPIAEPLARLRRSILPGLLRAVDLNLRRGSPDVRLFEVGRVFLARGDGEFPREPLRLGLAWAGAAHPPHWSAPSREVALYDLAGAVESTIGALRPGLGVERAHGCPRGFHPGQSLAWNLPSGERVAWCGALHPEIRESHDLQADLFLAEIDLETLGRFKEQVPQQAPLPRVPAVTRDLSLVIGRETSFGQLLNVLSQVPAPAPVELNAIDRYRGEPLGPDEVSLTVRVTLRPLEQSLTDEETESYRAKLVEALDRQLGVKIRS